LIEPGLGISRRIGQITKGTFDVKPGSLFQALHRMEQAGWLTSSWGKSENNRRARYYCLTKADSASWVSKKRSGLLAEEKISAGLNKDVARRQTLIEIGGIEQVKEQVRSTPWQPLGEHLQRHSAIRAEPPPVGGSGPSRNRHARHRTGSHYAHF
jgi:DNA-binding PadR family transcriptional regulator